MWSIRSLYIASAMLYQVHYRASSPKQSHGDDNVTQTVKCIRLHIMHYSKSFLRTVQK